MSIATKTGDKGQTALIGGERVSKADFRVETYGTIDELGAAMGFARSICDDAGINELTKKIQRELFLVAGSVANPRFEDAPKPYVTPEMVDDLTAEVGRIESMEGILSDWSLPGDVSSAAAYDVARTICRRAERCVVRMHESGENVDTQIITYLNRLSDLLWLIGRYLELKAGVDSSLRDDEHKGNKWSRAW
ncbi:MAG TPA: cob(I)yrinic acid a,c-diamide adenosyltransferase [Pyrinomonadaceae bacterium]|nr:cob(I)yrinic acid a,c-diamide adenosyltransferase [Pyrinomonadaceae bacterium]HNU07212.1 cob(I)yrinic acid a,c-diamide adenosyltransferase [Pyrinomonadaceae bacterium]